MIRRTIAKHTTGRNLGVQFNDGHGVTTQAERSAQRLEAARASVGMIRV